MGKIVSSEKIVDGATGVKVYLRRLFADETITYGDVKVVIFELVQNGNFQKMFGELGEKRRCWKNKEEALAFAEQNTEKLGPNSNFFELEGGFVANVNLDGDGQPYVNFVSPLSNDSAWYAGFQPRVFYPQQ
ncbi:hypothetical protein A2643_00585 [Candidatus Nomurabacteria bacterium RIFCSPHIGHO2_01_FULL_39_220]|nr:MAG: hypothetical protein A2643_00585 [Candidatus Nomurabacteria bacterium RIFCSPHIGHO2_01_FULL_39_220]OGI73472.1 MAG: hypothetical protein A2W56_02185 [Candidatus Nomurabacteria bacterium RIFCSPHIGHO2_02_41_18]OGI78741.1 MAG: hypothetical protein A3C65_02115 [Candidatus Nomurabacteria bacterium RIFCSPHIGHO2_02_FULL_41_150]OGI80818.1 MAG: hypothetical protein A3E03_03730 [Candidatus Nomurabacteria bacterium RIFCSPHIGHO2_12_FULL_40_64]OGI91995.1 MAG: hypothetical protein A3A06_00875 [Candidat